MVQLDTQPVPGTDPREVIDQRDQILDLVRRYESSFNDNDASAMNALFLPDAVFVNFGGNLVRGAEELYRAQAFVFAPGGPLEQVRVLYLAENLLFVDRDVAVVHARQRSADADGAPKGPDDSMEAVLMLLVVRVPDGWRIRVGQNTPVM